MHTKYNHILIAALLAVLSGSCQPDREIDVTSGTASGNVVITATLEMQDTASKTSLTSAGKVLWSKEDEIAVMTSSTKDKFVLVSGDNTSSAEFRGELNGSAPYTALYPYSDNCLVDGDSLKFALPQEQSVSGAGTFGNGCSPAVATLDSPGAQVQFRNLCGVLKLNLYGSGVKVKRIAVSDLNGAPLWGDCSLALDGTQGTDGQTMTVSGGSNTVILDLRSEVTLSSSSASAKSFDIVVPAGTLKKGFSARLYDKSGKAVAFLSTQASDVAVTRSSAVTMAKVQVKTDYAESADVTARGYFKEMIVDAGKRLNNVCNPPAADSLGWQHDYVSTSDSIFQNKMFVGDDNDLNGILLYPDNEPRYRMLYINGGSSRPHGVSLTPEGLRNMVTFVDNGGSYVGTCAGACIASTGRQKSSGSRTLLAGTEYLGIYPEMIQGMDYYDTCSHHTIVNNSPLLKYYDFGGDMRIDSVRFNGGCLLPESNVVPGTEIMARYVIASPASYNKKISVWAYKANDVKGRVVVTGGHPESVATGERLHMMKAMCQYAVEGNGRVTEKGVLTNGEERRMDQLSSAERPENARIGDRQYHHFRLEIPAGGAKNVTISLVSNSSKNLMLGLRKGDFAWRSDADFLLVQSGSNKILNIDALPAGIWYVSVCCPDAPGVSCGSSRFTYSGDKTLLNGVPYSITASWK